MRRNRRLAGLAGLLVVAAAAAAAPAIVSGQGTEPPEAVTGEPNSLHVDSARLRGTVDPNGNATTWFFEYGPTRDYGSETPIRSAGAGGAPVAVSAEISGLKHGAVYHYRLVASSAGDTVTGDDVQFGTLDPRVQGRFRTNIRVRSGGSAFGQSKGKSAARSYRFKARCTGVRCKAIRLVRGGKRGKFRSNLTRRGGDEWAGVERFKGRCDNGLRFHSRNRIVLRAVGLDGDRADRVRGSMRIRAKGCVKGKERASFRGSLR